ncbi:unnamed protein product [Sphagnum balticum]
MRVRIAECTNVLKNVNKRVNEYSGREQYHAKEILTTLKKSLPADAFCLIGVCTTDLYPRDEWNFVFGLASIRERTGVFSFARYDERFDGEGVVAVGSGCRRRGTVRRVRLQAGCRRGVRC